VDLIHWLRCEGPPAHGGERLGYELLLRVLDGSHARAVAEREKAADIKRRVAISEQRAKTVSPKRYFIREMHPR